MSTSTRTVSRLSRILALIPFVLSNESANLDEVLDRFGYTKEQLTRDLNTVFVCGLPGYGPGDLMEAYIDEDEVIIDAADYFTRAPRLTPTEALALLAAGMAVVGSGEGSPELSSAVEKLTAAVMPEAEDSLAVDVPGETEFVGSLREAAAAQKVAHITYRSVGKEEVTERAIEPWSVFATLGRWYVTGHCRLVDEERTFRVDRIRNLEILEESFERPVDVPDPGVGYSPAPGDVSCDLELLPAARWVLEYYPVELLEDDGEHARIRFSSPDVEVPARLLLRLGSSAKLLDGDEVGERVTQLGHELLLKYQ